MVMFSTVAAAGFGTVGTSATSTGRQGSRLCGRRPGCFGFGLAATHFHRESKGEDAAEKSDVEDGNKKVKHVV